jgi:hypothetical protein
MTQPSETPRTDALWYQHTSDPRLLNAADGEDTVSIELIQYREMAEHAQQLERELSAAERALAEKERELTEIRAEAFDKIMAAETRAGEASRLLQEVRGRWEWKGPAREDNFESFLRDIDTALGEGKAT